MEIVGLWIVCAALPVPRLTEEVKYMQVETKYLIKVNSKKRTYGAVNKEGGNINCIDARRVENC